MDPVAEQLEAYNARDIDRFVACYAPDVTIEHGQGNVVLKGHEAMRTKYGALFEASPKLKCRLVNRIRVGAYVIDEEEVTGSGLEGSPDRIHAAAIYRVQDDKIAHVLFLA
jgi:hypothetical protein